MTTTTTTAALPADNLIDKRDAILTALESCDANDNNSKEQLQQRLEHINREIDKLPRSRGNATKTK